MSESQPRRYAVIDLATRDITRITTLLPEQVAPLLGEAYIESDVATLDSHYGNADGTGLIAYTADQSRARAQRPLIGAWWSNEAMGWVDPRGLAAVKAAKRAEINAARAAADLGTFTFGGRAIQADAVSQARIVNVALVVAATGELPPNFPGFWKAADNAPVAIPDVATWRAFHAAMVAKGTANFATSEQLKAQLASAATREEVDAITWPTT